MLLFQVKMKMFILPPAEKMHNVGFQGNKKRENLTNKLWMISTPEGFRYHYPHSWIVTCIGILFGRRELIVID